MLFIKRFFIGLLSFIVISFTAFLIIYSTTDWVNDGLSDYLNSLLYGDAQISFKNMRGSLYNEAEFDDFELILKSGLTIRAKYVHAKFDLNAIIDGRYHLSFLYTDSLNIDFTDKSRRQVGLLDSPDDPYYDIYKEMNNTEVVVNRLEVRKGRFRFGKSNEGLFDGINFDGHFIFTEEKIDVKVNNLKTEWGKQEDLLLFKTHVTGGPELVQFNQTEFHYNDSKVIGKVLYKFNEANDFNIFVDESKINSNDIHMLTGDLSETDFVSFNAQINGNHLGFNSKLAIDSALYKEQNFKQSYVESFYNFNKSTLNVFKSSIDLNNAHFELKGTLFGSEGHDVKVKFEKIDLNQFGVSIDHTSLNGKAILNQTELDFSGVSNLLNNIQLSNSTVGNIFISKSNINFDNDVSGFYLKKGSSISFDNDSEFNLSGNIAPDRNYMSVFVKTDSAEISALMKNFGVTSLKGNVSSNTRVYGNISNPKAFVNVMADSLQLIDDFMVFDANLNMVLGSLTSNLNGTARLTSDSVRIANNIFNEFDIYTTLKKDSIKIENITLLSDTNGLELSGNIVLEDSTVQYFIDDFQITYEKYRFKNDDKIHLYSEENGLKMDKFQMSIVNGGILTFDGLYNINNVTDLNIELDNIEIRPFNQLIDYKYNLGGAIAGTISISDLDNFSYDLNGEISNFNIYPKNDSTLFKNIRLDSVNYGIIDLQYGYKSGIYDIKRLQISDNFSEFNLSGEINTSYLFEDTTVTRENLEGLNLESSFKNVDLNKSNIFIGYYKEIEGLLDGNLKITGTISHPKGELTINSKKLNINQLTYNGFLNASLDKDKITINDSKIKINETSFIISGYKLIDLDANNFGDLMQNGNFDFNVNASGDTLTSINSLIPDIRAIYGKFTSNVNIVGTFAEPRIKSGTLSLNKSRLILDKLANPIDDITHKFIIKNGKLLLNNFKGYTYKEGKSFLGIFKLNREKGTLTANGSIDLNNILHPVMDIKIKLDKFYADYHYMNAKVLLSTNNISVQGRDTLLLRGVINLNEATIYIDLNEISKKNFYESTQSISNRFTIMDFDVNMKDNVRIYHEDPTSTRSFDMYLKTTNGQPMKYYKGADDKEQMRGVINIESGTFTFIRPFEITKGIINLSDQDNTTSSFNPKVDFESEYESDEYYFNVGLNDYLTNLSRVQVTVALAESPNQNLNKDNFQIVNLLLFGEEDFTTSDNVAGSALKNVLNIFASEQLDLIQEFNFDNEKDEADPNKSSNEYSVKFKTKQLQIYESWKVQAIFNSNNNRVFDLIETSIRVLDNLVIYLAVDQSSDLSTTDDVEKYNLRLQWYYEF